MSKYNETQTEERFRNKITIVSYILAVFVVYIHGNNTTTYTFSQNNPFDNFVFWFEDWCQGWQHVSVPLFYIISGFLFFRNYSQNMFQKKMKTRVKSLLIPYIVWNLVPWLLLLTVGLLPIAKSIGIHTDISLKSLYECFVLCKYSVLWYIRNLIIFVVLTPLIYQLMSKKKYGVCAIGLAVAFNFLWLAFVGNKTAILYWLPFYLTGSWLGCNNRDWFVERANRKTRIISTIGLFGCMIWAMFPQYVLFNYVGEYAYRVAIPLLFWFAMEIFDFHKATKWFLTLSFPIYCVHDILSSFVEKVILIYLGNDIHIAFASYLLTPAVVITMITLICYIGKKYLPMVYSVVFGMRG